MRVGKGPTLTRTILVLFAQLRLVHGLARRRYKGRWIYRVAGPGAKANLLAVVHRKCLVNKLQ
jgi:hypothetical protein